MAARDFLYTVGHSNHSPAYFLELLRSQHIDCLVDVRSTPMSSYTPHFNEKPLQAFLQPQGIRLLPFGQAFGARRQDPALQDEEGRVDFRKVQQSRSFQDGVRRLEKGLAEGYRIALMCAEADPLSCHRFSMVARYLSGQGLQIWHLLKDQSLQSHQALEAQLLEKFAKKLPQPSLFQPDIGPEEQLAAAYRLHNRSIGWQKEKPS